MLYRDRPIAHKSRCSSIACFAADGTLTEEHTVKVSPVSLTGVFHPSPWRHMRPLTAVPLDRLPQ